MKLEEAIKQTKPFKSQYTRANINIIYTSNWLSRQMGKYFDEFGVTKKQYNILRILKGAEKPVSVAYIRERLIDPLSDVSRIINRMEKKGMVEKQVCEGDKRLVDIHLTTTGMQLIEDARGQIQKMDDLLKNLNSKEIEELNNLLDKIRGTRCSSGK